MCWEITCHWPLTGPGRLQPAGRLGALAISLLVLVHTPYVCAYQACQACVLYPRQVEKSCRSWFSSMAAASGRAPT